ncbi:hypothetical protein KSP40_PGU008374 [Platanthera guangdongensis]|uniref:Uncharacterized protein n=1 Tax=Platanthera guangdongensis TaxID=2320717 RepID=A0ABR2LI37_9ASPA
MKLLKATLSGKNENLVKLTLKRRITNSASSFLSPPHWDHLKKAAADSIKGLVSVIHSIVLQQNAELSLQKKLKRLENRLDKELKSISPPQNTSPDHQPSSNNAKIDSLKKMVEEEKAKYLTSICVSRAMTLNNLHTCLPNVFHALVAFSNVCVQAHDNIIMPHEAATGC